MGEEKRNYAKTRQIIDYDHVISQIGGQGIICIDKGVLSIIRVLLRTRGMWRTSYATSWGDGSYNIPSVAEFGAIDIAISEFLEETNDMGLCEDLLTAIESIALSVQAISAQGCCESGSGGVSPGTTPVDYEDDGATPPDGFSSYPAYDSHKCAAADWFMNSVESDLNYLLAADYVALGAAGLAAAFLIPGINVLALIGVVAFAVSAGLFSSSVNDVLDWIDGHATELRCQLYQSTNASNAYNNLQTYINNGSLDDLEKQILLYFITVAGINKAFTFANIPPSTFDCGDCDDCPPYTVSHGTITSSGDHTVTVQSTDSGDGYQMCEIYFYHNGSSYCSSTTVSLTTYVGSEYVEDEQQASYDYFVKDQAGSVLQGTLSWGDGTHTQGPVSGAAYARTLGDESNVFSTVWTWTDEPS